MTEVVAALIWDGEKFMICQRPAHKARGLLWEFAGGKVEPGETKQQALIRECREELAVTLSVGEPLDTMDIGAHRKFIGKCDSAYLCRDCIAEYFGWTRETLDGWIRRFQENGCMLFPPLKKECPAGGNVKMVDAESGFDG